MPALQPQPSIDDTRTRAHLAIGDRLRTLDLTPLLVYRIDSVVDSALAPLAWQFDVANVLFQLLAPGDSPRALLKAAIPLHATLGTPAAIKTALESLGWPNVTIQEGQASWGGTSYPISQGWAVSRLLVPMVALSSASAVPWTATTSYPTGSIVSYLGKFFYAGSTVPVGLAPMWGSTDQVTDPDALTNSDDLVPWPWFEFTPGVLSPITSRNVDVITAAFAFFAPRRSWLDAIFFEPPAISDSTQLFDLSSPGAADVIQMTDSFSVVLLPVADSIRLVPDHSARWQHAGIQYNKQPVGIVDGAVVVNGTPEEGNP